MTNTEELRQRLFNLADEKYKDFQCRLMPTVNPNSVIGVRMPDLRRLAKTIAGTDIAREFCSCLPHTYYDENNLHGILICLNKGYEETIHELEAFLPFVDNWATCDMMTPRSFQGEQESLLPKIHVWLESGVTYTQRFAIEMLMNFFLDREFKPEYLYEVISVQNEDYYIKMMKAWYFATALAKQYDETLPVLERRLLPVWTHNKTIRKAIESYRISEERKNYLRSLSVKI